MAVWIKAQSGRLINLNLTDSIIAQSEPIVDGKDEVVTTRGHVVAVDLHDQITELATHDGSKVLTEKQAREIVDCIHRALGICGPQDRLTIRQTRNNECELSPWVE